MKYTDTTKKIWFYFDDFGVKLAIASSLTLIAAFLAIIPLKP